MRSFTFVAVGLMFELGGLVAPRPMSAQVVVALSGTPAPAGGSYSSFPYSPALNASGQVAFVAGLSGGSSTEGLFAGAPGSLQAVALQGAAAPRGGTYDINHSNASYTFGPPVLNATGQVAFTAGLDPYQSSNRGIFVGAPGLIQAAALTLDVAPQAGGGRYTVFANILKLNDSGQVAYLAGLDGSSSGGIFVGAPGSIQAAGLTSIHNPTTNFAGPSALNGSGQVAFTYHGGGAIFVGAPGSIQTVAIPGAAALAGGNYGGAGGGDLNGSGQLAFVASLYGGSSTEGIFVGAPGSIQAVALQDGAAPGGGAYNNFSGPFLNGSGQVAFVSNLTGGSSSGDIFIGAPGSVQALAAFTDDGRPPALNDAGQVAFVGFLPGGPGEGLFAGSPGALETILLVGDIMNVASGGGVDDRTVSSVDFNVSGSQDGNPMSFNDSGLLVYEVGFTDGSSAILTSQITPVPEPSSLALGLLALGALALLAPRRKRVS